jgi:hypothetical protein
LRHPDLFDPSLGGLPLLLTHALWKGACGRPKFASGPAPISHSDQIEAPFRAFCPDASEYVDCVLTWALQTYHRSQGQELAAARPNSSIARFGLEVRLLANSSIFLDGGSASLRLDSFDKPKFIHDGPFSRVDPVRRKSSGRVYARKSMLKGASLQRAKALCGPNEVELPLYRDAPRSI